MLLETTKCYNAIRYHLVALDENNNIVYENDSKTNIIDISEINLLYKQNINFEVVTYNRKNESKKSDKAYSYINQVAAFGDDKNYSTDKEDIKMKIDGFNIQENYHLELYYKDSVILKKDITEEEFEEAYAWLKTTQSLTEDYQEFKLEFIVSFISSLVLF